MPTGPIFQDYHNLIILVENSRIFFVATARWNRSAQAGRSRAILRNGFNENVLALRTMNSVETL